MNDDQYLLANAYVDGELTDDERRTAEADPTVMAEVESLIVLRARIADVDPPLPDVRDAAIAAAMTEFSRRSPAVSTTVEPPQRRSFGSRYLAIAAAVVGVGLLGVIVATVGNRGQNDADSATEATESDIASSVADQAAPNADRETADVAADSAADEMSADMSSEMSLEMAQDVTGAAADGGLADDATSDTSSPSNAATVMATEPLVDVDPAYDTAGPDAQRSTLDVDAPITDDLELGAYGTYLLDQQLVGRLPPTPNTKCPPDLNILDERVIVLNDDDTDVYIAVQVIDQRVIAVDRETCVPLVDGPLFVDRP
ncbi:MAG: hypothetical protein ABIP17_10115 [Ilumatobacteraceae bacterium]